METVAVAKNVANWFIIPSLDFNRAVGFYSAIFDIQLINAKDPDGRDLAFFLDPQSDAVNGGIGSNPDRKPGKDGAIIYLNADGILDEVLGRVEAAGGKISFPKTDIGDLGFYALIDDTEGNRIGLHSSN